MKNIFKILKKYFCDLINSLKVNLNYFDKKYILIIVLLSIIWLVYLNATSFIIREHDVFGHIKYMREILTHFGFPPTNACYMCYHPPLYYLSALPVYGLFYVLDFFPGYFLQVLSMLYMLGFVFFSFRIFTLFSSNKNHVFIATLLTMLFPTVIIHSVRVGNDPLFYFLFAGGLFYTLRWWLKRRDRDFALAIIISSLSMLTKFNGILLVFLIAILFVIVYKKSLFKMIRKHFKIILIPVLAIAYVYIRKILSGGGLGIVENTGFLNNTITITNQLSNFVSIDWNILLNKTYTSPFDDALGRQYYWIYLFKTSLFGEFRFVNVNPLIPSIMIWSMIGLVMGSIVGFVIALLKKETKYLPLFLLSTIMIVGSIGLRLSSPYSSSNDFRYILPIVISLVVMNMRLFKTKFKFPILIILAIFIISSVIFILDVGF